MVYIFEDNEMKKQKFTIKYKNNYPGSANPTEIITETIETTETQEQLLKHAHVVEVKKGAVKKEEPTTKTKK